MKFNQLRDVVAVAERGSLRAAARHLHLAQPALSRSIASLELELGGALFERRARGMILTPVGQAFVGRARSVLSEVRRARDEVAQLQGGTRGSVVAGLSTVPHIGMLRHAVRPFRARYPDIQLHLIEGNYLALQAGLKDNSIDFYIGPQPETALAADFVQQKLFDNTRVILGRIGHPLSKARSLRQLKDAEWVTTSITSRAEEELGEVFRRHKLPAPKLALRSQSALTLISSLAYSDLLAMVPVQWVYFEITNRVLAPIAVKEIFPAPPIVAVRRNDLPLTPAAGFFLELLQSRVPETR